MKSLIVDYITTHNNWREDFARLGIKVASDGDYTIFKYSSLDADFSNPLVCEARGIILKNLNTVVAWSFNKFFNVQEQYAAKIDWAHAKVQEKIDGSLIKLWYDAGQWRWSTNGTIDAAKTLCSDGSTTFLELIQSAINYKDIDYNKLNPKYTYTFELVSPLQRIVIVYPCTKLYHIGTRDNISGEELNENIGIEKPKEYSLSSLDDCLRAVQALNAKEGDPEHEGFVAVDNKWRRVKIKTPEYIAQHKLRANGAITKTIALTADEAKRAVIAKVPSANVILKWYDYQLAKFENEVDQYINYVRGLYEEYEHDRKAVALTIKGDKLSSFGFRSLGNKLSAHEIVAQTPINAIEKYLEDYHA